MTTADTAHGDRSRSIYAGVTAAALLIAAGLWVVVALTGHPAPGGPAPLYVTAILFVAFLAGEVFPLRFEVRSEVLMVSLSEIPLVIGVLLLPAVVVGPVYGAAACVAFLLRRGRPRVVVMNLALVALETGIAFAVVAVAGADYRSGGLLAAVQPELLPVACGVIAGAVASAAAVALVRRLDGVVEPAARVIARSGLIAALITGLTLAGFTVWLAVPSGPILCVTLLAAAALLYRSYAGFIRQHAHLADLYAFGASVARIGADDDAWQDLAARVRERLGVKVAALTICDRAGGDAVFAVGPSGQLTVDAPAPDNPILAQARARGGVIAEVPAVLDPEIERALGTRGAVSVMVAALRVDDRNRGYVGVWDTRSYGRRFRPDDLALLEAFAGHLATALDNHRLLASLQHAAHHDPVTGLVNRLGLEARSDELFATGRRPGVLLLEFDALGDVTGALGHDHADRLLLTMSARLVEFAGAGRAIGRVDADRFAILIESGDEAHTLAFAQELLAAADAPIEVDGIEVESNVVIGIALPAGVERGRQVSPTQNELLQQAQLALTAARSKDERIALYRPEVGETYHRRFRLVSQFRHAVDAGQVAVYYQPKVALAERELIGVEALVRWHHPEYGFVSPAELIDAIEPTSAIDVLFAHVLDESLAQIAAWVARGVRIPVAVNLSVRNLLAPDLVQTIASRLSQHAVPSELLALEVTESSVMNQPERSLPILRELHEMGIRLSMDDFGTGYSSLAYLRRLPIDELKIDKSFVQGMVTDLGDLAIVRAIIDLGHSLGMRVIAEGVEEEAGRDALRSMRCDAMQGFLLSRPLPIDRFESWLTSRTVSDDHPTSGVASVLRLKV